MYKNRSIKVVAVLNKRATLTFFFKLLKLSIITPTNKFRTKNEPTTMNATKKQYAESLFSNFGCLSTYKEEGFFKCDSQEK